MSARLAGAAAVIAFAAVAGIGGGVTAAAASLALSETEKQEALRVGAGSVNEDAFEAEWHVKNGTGETVSVITPFHRLVLAARHATFKNEPLKPGEPEKLLREQRERLLLWVALNGDREDFARLYDPVLVVGDRTIKAAFVQNERTALRRDGESYLARCVYGFPTKEITGKSRVTLVVRDTRGRPASTFTIDLAAMR